MAASTSPSTVSRPRLDSLDLTLPFAVLLGVVGPMVEPSSKGLTSPANRALLVAHIGLAAAGGVLGFALRSLRGRHVSSVLAIATVAALYGRSLTEFTDGCDFWPTWTIAATACFGALSTMWIVHGRSSGARSGSLLAAVDRRTVWLSVAFGIGVAAVLARKFDAAFRPPTRTLGGACLAFVVLTSALVVRDRRQLARLRRAAVGEREALGTTDVGVGDALEPIDLESASYRAEAPTVLVGDPSEGGARVRTAMWIRAGFLVPLCIAAISWAGDLFHKGASPSPRTSLVGSTEHVSSNGRTAEVAPLTLDDLEWTVRDILISPHGARLLTVGSNRLAMWDRATRERLWSTTSGKISAALAFDLSGARVLVVDDHRVRWIDAETGADGAVLNVVDDRAGTAPYLTARSADGTQLAVVTGMNSVSIIDLMSDAPVRSVMHKWIGDDHAIVFDDAGDLWSVGDKGAHRWSDSGARPVETRKLPGVASVSAFAATRHAVVWASVEGDGGKQHVLMADRDRADDTIVSLDLPWSSTEECARRTCTDLALTSVGDGRYVVVAGVNGAALVDPKEKRVAQTLAADGRWVHALSASRDGRWIAAAVFPRGKGAPIEFWNGADWIASANGERGVR